MQAVHELIAGLRGAENGHAELYVYGTSNRAMYYSDFEGTVSPTTGADLPLDSNGGAVVYVNQLVDVSAFSSAGVLIRDFTEGDAAPNVEVQSLAFTGVNRTTGASAAGEPTTAQAIFDLWLVSAGAKDWKVLVNGVATNLKNAIAAVAGIFFNVKDPAYGAAGDGTTDDTTPIQNCITAAGLVKGTVVFPAGTYRTTSALNVPIGVSLWGVGSSGTAISLDLSTGNVLTYNPGIASGSAYQEIRNISLGVAQSNNGNVVSISGAAGVTLAIYNSILGGVNNTSHTINVTNAVNDLLLDGCIVNTSGNATRALTADVANAKVRARNTRFVIGLGAYNETGVLVRNGTFTACTFDISATSSGTNTMLGLDGAAGSGPKVTVSGCEFIFGTATTTAMALTNANEATTTVAESGNIFRSMVSTSVVYSGFTAQSALPSILALSRQTLGYTLTDNTAAVSVKADQYGYTALTRTATGAQTLTSPIGPSGSEWTLVLFNNGGGALGTVTFGAGFAAGTPTITALGNGKLAMYTFKAFYVNGAAAWLPVATQIKDV